MLKNSLKVTLRGFFRNRMFTGFNLCSLVIGLLVSYLAIGYIEYEYSYDTFHEDSENTYRLARTYRSQDYSVIGFENYANSTSQRSQVNRFKKIPGVEHVAQFITSNDSEYVEWQGNRIQEKAFLTTNTPAEFVNVFSWEAVAGSIADFGKGVNKLLLATSSAERIFGEAFDTPNSVIGEAVTIGESVLEVAAVIEDVPLNSHFDFHMAISKPQIDYWGSRMYFKLSENAIYTDVENRINAAVVDINPNLVKDPLYQKHYLQPLESLHLDSNILYESKPPGNRSFIFLIGFFALFILIITLFNYANFTLAVKSKQGKSIGVQKVMGANKGAIAFQFMMEGVVLTVISIPILMLLVGLVVPYFNSLMGISLETNLLANLSALGLMTGLAFAMGILASSTPAFYLSGKKTLALFKENLRDNRFQHFSIRKYLIVSQFVLLITISCVSYFVLSQIRYIENKDIGFQKENVLFAYTSPENQDYFQEQLRGIPEIKQVGNGSSFGIETYNQTTYKLQGSEEVFDDANQLYLDYGALKAYNLETSLGTLELQERITLINRTAAEKLAKVKNVSPSELIGTMIITEPEYVSESGDVGFPFRIGGIFEDVNVFSLREKIASYFVTVSPAVRMNGRSIVSYEPGKTKAVADKITKIHQSMKEPFPLEIEFLSQNITQLYKRDRQTATLISWMNGIAIGLAGMGIIGITLFLVVARTKEIGIRRVLGASEFHIIKGTLKEYVFFIGLALLISWPLAYYGSEQWLSNFAYRIGVQQFVFVGVGLLTFIFTALLVGIVAFRAARANPAKSLRTE